MYDPYRHRSTKGRTNLASCIVATVFLLIVVAAIVIVFFFFFKPKEPNITVEAVRFPTFSVANGTVNFTFFQNVTVRNPNRDAFTHYDSSLQLVYSGSEVGFAFIPSGKIDAGHTQRMSAKFAVESFPLKSAVSGVTTSAIGDGGVGMGVVGPTMEIESRMELVGRVRVLKVFTHRVETRMRCSVAIEVSDGSVLGFHC
ncbi:uncharacterized protein LOC132276788 [Cornus florida]|uniref:uncharacterized protein LOC132276788 n=1 Tax=Cornus florida TaxID=4283 RepID=UPI00289E29EE|nr:uncharacterized protein LOC132276788 [Cornus florida]